MLCKIIFREQARTPILQYYYNMTILLKNKQIYIKLLPKMDIYGKILNREILNES